MANAYEQHDAAKLSPAVPGFEFDEEADLAQSPAWFLDGTHSVPPWTPLFGWFWINFCRHGMQYGAEKLSLPTVKGWDWRFKNGGGYLTVLLVKSEVEQREREPRFRQAIRPFVENYDGLWRSQLDEILGLYDGLKKLDLDKASNIELLDNFEQTINVCRRMWEVHMYMMYGTYTAYILFENMCRELLQIDDTNPMFHHLIRSDDQCLPAHVGSAYVHDVWHLYGLHPVREYVSRAPADRRHQPDVPQPDQIGRSMSAGACGKCICT